MKGNKSGYQLESINDGYCRSISTCYFKRLHKLDFGDQIYDYFCLMMNLVCIVLVPVNVVIFLLLLPSLLPIVFPLKCLRRCNHTVGLAQVGEVGTV